VRKFRLSPRSILHGKSASAVSDCEALPEKPTGAEKIYWRLLFALHYNLS
jgi:hypothetical protein